MGSNEIFVEGGANSESEQILCHSMPSSAEFSSNCVSGRETGWLNQLAVTQTIASQNWDSKRLRSCIPVAQAGNNPTSAV